LRCARAPTCRCSTSSDISTRCMCRAITCAATAAWCCARRPCSR
jgi:hypothetical protein